MVEEPGSRRQDHHQGAVRAGQGAAALGASKTLYDANREVYGLLRYGVKVQPDVGEQNITVWLIDWKNPANNDFALAEEVTVAGKNTKRPDLVRVLNAGDEWLIGSLIHKFGGSEEISEKDVENHVEEIRKSLPREFHAKGAIFVFVDECHRTQSGKLHEAMKALLPGALLIGFTGTPLLKDDKRRSIKTFGPYIHACKYDEAVGDGVVLDLRCEARDIDQNLTSQATIDQWFDLKTRGLTDVAKAQLKQRWGTMRKVLSARDRLEKIVADLLLDMETRDRLKSGRGNAMLVPGNLSGQPP